MRHYLFTGIALSSVIFTGVTLGNSVHAKTLNSKLESNRQITNTSKTSTYIALSNNSLTSIEQAVQTQINQYRQQHNLPPLTIDERISNIARIHSQNMASGAVPFSHNGFQERVGAIAKIIPLSASAENVAYNKGYSDPATQAVQGWLHSSGHLRNIEGNYNQTGIGVAMNDKGEYYFTQIFIRKR